jgi:hypothetical protein
MNSYNIYITNKKFIEILYFLVNLSYIHTLHTPLTAARRYCSAVGDDRKLPCSLLCAPPLLLEIYLKTQGTSMLIENFEKVV